MRSKRLILGIDGGGTKTVAWLAACRESDEPVVLGRGTAGPSNPQAVEPPVAFENLGRAIDEAFDDAELEPGTVDAAVLAVAGSGRAEQQRAIEQWAEHRALARRVRVVHDALPVLAAGSPEGWGVALIAGTGSLAYGCLCDGRSSEGHSARAGGWGYLFGD